MHWQDLKDLKAEVSKDPELTKPLAEAKSLARRALGWLLFNELLLVTEIYPIASFINALGAHPMDHLRAYVSLGVMLGLYMASTVVRWFMDTRRGRFYLRMWSLLWGYGHRVEQRQSVRWHKQHSTGDKESVMTKNVAKVDILIDEAVFEAIPTVLRVVLTTIGIGVFIGWQYGLLGAITTVVLDFAAARSNHRLSNFRQEARRDERFLERFGTEMTTNWRTLKYFGMEQRRCRENQIYLDRHYLKEAQRFRLLVNTLCTQEVIVNLSRACLWALIIIGLKPNVTTIGGSVLALSWMERIYSNFYRISSFQRRLNESWESLKELVGLMTNVPEIRQPERPEWPNLEGHVEFRNVTFAYSGTDQPAISDFNLVVEPNQTIALVGASGSGKSTLVELLMRSYDPCEGAVMIDGVELNRYDYDRYRSEAVSIVSQDVQLFDLSIRENIRFGRPDASDEQVIAAARQAYADNFIAGFPQGYDTLVGEDGILLSGGQKQRLAIARALLRQPRVLVLDEATSSLDAESQYYVKQAIDQLIADRACTIFVIAHRLSTVREADLIVVLEDGRISDTGSHTELANRDGFYRRMCELENVGILDED